jgi:NADH-quinone oxidoreductase subunit H
MGFAWKFLLPVAMINMLITAVQVIYFPSLPWPIILVNLVVLGVLILLWSRLYRLGGGRIGV